MEWGDYGGERRDSDEYAAAENAAWEAARRWVCNVTGVFADLWGVAVEKA